VAVANEFFIGGGMILGRGTLFLGGLIGR